MVAQNSQGSQQPVPGAQTQYMGGVGPPAQQAAGQQPLAGAQGYNEGGMGPPVQQEQPLVFYVKRKGYNDIRVLDGPIKTAPCFMYADVGAKVTGWDITLRRGSDKAGAPLFHIGKGTKVYDKNTRIFITNAQPGSAIDANFDAKHRLKGEFMKEAKLRGMHEQQPVTVMQHPHELTSNQTLFEYGGRTYEWNWTLLISAKHILTDVETKEVVAVGQLVPSCTWQIIMCLGLRLNGTLSITGRGKEFPDVIIASFIAIMEWRRHNNKYWFAITSLPGLLL